MQFIDTEVTFISPTIAHSKCYRVVIRVADFVVRKLVVGISLPNEIFPRYNRVELVEVIFDEETEVKADTHI